jgi:hypothetical protein
MLAAALGRAEFRFHCVFNWFNDYVAALRCSKRLWSMVFRLMRCRSARMPLPGRPGQPPLSGPGVILVNGRSLL